MFLRDRTVARHLRLLLAPSVDSETAGPDRASTVSTTLYGPPRAPALTKEARDKRYWAWMPQFKHILEELEKGLKERERKKAENTISITEAEILEALTVTKVDLHIHANAFEHHTLYYHCTKGKDAQAVLRRGQEFTVTVTFSRSYQKDKDDLIFIFEAEEDNPGTKNLKDRFTLDEEGTAAYKEREDWGARILELHPENNSMALAVYIPADCVVGEWELRIKTQLLDKVDEDYVYLHPKPIIVLFNPWSKVDQVHFTESKDLLKEYILNSAGTYYAGLGDFPKDVPWTYGQFDEGILHICLSLLRKAFGFKMTPTMADPVSVARALSRIVNSTDDMGVLVGNWSGKYSGGKSPQSWESSAAILRQYESSGQPVKFGQCWVFSHVLTAVCRALGLPCRSVTTFSSAHDTDNTCTIDRYFTREGDELTNMKNDSIWNFHVWNEVWILRPDLAETGDYDGWQAIDATPQEQSHGVYQCGPCPVAAIKRGEITVGFDTAFVFSEVNADVVDWIVDDKGDVISASAVNKTKVGSRISTKIPDGKGHRKLDRLDITDAYKFPEGSEEERLAMKRAVRFTCHGKRLFPENANLDVTFDVSTQPMIGQNIVVIAHVRNLTLEDRDVTFILALRTCRYWDHSNGVESLRKENFPLRTIKPGDKEEYSVTVSAKDYLDKMDDHMSFFAYACANDVKVNMPYSNQQGFSLRVPELEIEGPKTAESEQPVSVTASFLNPYGDTSLTGCSWFLNGDLFLAEDDENKAARFGTAAYIENVPDVKGGEKASVTLRVYGEIEAEEDGRRKIMNINFGTTQFDFYIKGCFTLKLTKPRNKLQQPDAALDKPGAGTPLAVAVTDNSSLGPTPPEAGTATQPESDTNKPGSGPSPPASGTSQPPSGITQPAAGATQPAAEANQPADGNNQPTQPGAVAGTTQPAASATQPTGGTTQPVAEATQPGGGATQPGGGATQPSAGAIRPPSGTTQPEAGATQPGGGATQPSAGATQPPSGTTQPEAGATQPGGGTTQPAAGATQPPGGTTQPAARATQPGGGETRPIAEATQPGGGTTYPAAGTTQPGGRATPPAARTTQPVRFVRPAAGTTRPAMGATQPAAGRTLP